MKLYILQAQGGLMKPPQIWYVLIVSYKLKW